MSNFWWEGGWIRDAMGNLRFYRPQMMKEGAWTDGIEPEVILDWRAYMHLKNWMIENDKDRIVHTNRDEDLKIIHRTLDIIQSLSEKAKKDE